MERVVVKRSMHDPDDAHGDAVYWLSRPAGERFRAVEELRRTYYGWADGAEPRLQRVVHVTEMARSGT